MNDASAPPLVEIRNLTKYYQRGGRKVGSETTFLHGDDDGSFWQQESRL